MADRFEPDLAVAVRHVAEGRLIVVRQRQLIAELKVGGHPTLDHEKTLRLFESTLKIFEDHERSIRNRIST